MQVGTSFDAAAPRKGRSALGRLLASWLGSGETGSISTLPLGFKPVDRGEAFLQTCARQLLQLAAAWDRVWRDTGRQLVLGLEPEPACVLETSSEVVAFYEQHLLSVAAVRTLQGLGINAARAQDDAGDLVRALRDGGY